MGSGKGGSVLEIIILLRRGEVGNVNGCGMRDRGAESSLFLLIDGRSGLQLPQILAASSRNHRRAKETFASHLSPSCTSCGWFLYWRPQVSGPSSSVYSNPVSPEPAALPVSPAFIISSEAFSYSTSDIDDDAAPGRGVRGAARRSYHEALTLTTVSMIRGQDDKAPRRPATSRGS